MGEWTTIKSFCTKLATLLTHFFSPQPEFIRAIAFKVSLALGYTLVLVLLLNNYLVIKTMDEVKQENDTVANDYTFRSQLLDRIQMDVIGVGIVIRDFALTLESESAGDYKSKLLEIRESLGQNISLYAPLVTLEGERAAWATLQQEIADLWDSVDRILALYPGHPLQEIKELMNDTVVKKRRVQDIAERLHSVDQQAAAERRQQVAGMFKNFRRDMLVQTIASMLIGLIVAVVAYNYFFRLHSELVEQCRKDVENKENLRRLSAHLVHMQEEERKAISRELHDQIGQSLTGVRIILDKVARNLSSAQAGLYSDLREAKEVTEQMIKEVRELSHLLHPAVLDDLGLIPALQSYIDRFTRLNEIAVEFKASPIAERFSEEVETNLYRIVQEALCNVSKHAHAKQVQISLEQSAYAIELRVSDDGKGFLMTKPTPRNPGLGLLSMRERVAGLGGKLVVNSQPGCGTHLHVRLPVDKAPYWPSGIRCNDPAADLKG